MYLFFILGQFTENICVDQNISRSCNQSCTKKKPVMQPSLTEMPSVSDLACNLHTASYSPHLSADEACYNFELHLLWLKDNSLTLLSHLSIWNQSRWQHPSLLRLLIYLIWPCIYCCLLPALCSALSLPCSVYSFFLFCSTAEAGYGHIEMVMK